MRSSDFGLCKACRMRTSISMNSAICSNGWGLRSVLAAVIIIFRRHGVRELINLQREGSKVKVYQVRPVILRYGLEGGKE